MTCFSIRESRKVTGDQTEETQGSLKAHLQGHTLPISSGAGRLLLLPETGLRFFLLAGKVAGSFLFFSYLFFFNFSGIT